MIGGRIEIPGISRRQGDYRYLRIDGGNSPTATINWNNQDITNVGQLGIGCVPNALYALDVFGTDASRFSGTNGNNFDLILDAYSAGGVLTGRSRFRAQPTGGATWTVNRFDAGAASAFFDPIPSDGSSVASVKMFANSKTTGQTYLQIYQGITGGTTQHLIRGQGGDTYFNALHATDGYGFALGSTNAAAGYVLDVTGNAIFNNNIYVKGITRLGDLTTNYVEVESDGDVNFVGGAGLQFGEIWYHDGGFSTTCTLLNTYYQVLGFNTDGESNGSVTPDHTNDHITVGKAGRYLISYSGSASAAIADTYEFTVFYNNGATELTNSHDHVDVATAGRLRTFGNSFIADLPANATVELWVRNITTAGRSIDIQRVNLNVVQIGGTT